MFFYIIYMCALLILYIYFAYGFIASQKVEIFGGYS